MTNNRFIKTLTTILLLFFAILGGTGCGGGSGSSSSTPNSNPNANNIYTITFDSNGGSPVASQSVHYGEYAVEPDTPVKENFIFGGWYKDNNTFNELFIFGTGGEKITQDITLYAQWFDSDTLIVEYAISEIVIGYAKGDNAQHVTQNLTLPTKVDSADITWNSNSSAVSSNGTVTRQDADINVTLTATASYNGKISSPKTFEVKVIKKSTRVNSEIVALTIDEAKVGDVSVERDASGQITDIEGQYVDFDIDNADDALDALTVLRNELGIKNPANELETLITTSDKYSSEYSFRQIYEGVPVFGRIITASVNSFAKGDFLHSNILSSDILANSGMKITLSASDAEAVAQKYHGGSVEAASNSIELVIYSIGEYEYNPVYTYIVNAKGVNNDGIYIDHDIFVDANSGKIIGSFSKFLDAILVTGKNEHFKDVTFPVSEQGGYFCMVDMRDPVIEVYNGDVSHGILLWKKDNIAKRKPNEIWNDSQQVSAYSNMREIIDWWKNEFSRNSLDDNGMTVQIVTHDQRKGTQRDNAAWELNLKRIYISDAEERPYSSASAVDVLTHESTHAVMQYTTCFDEWNLNDTLRAIAEGYADIFACIKDKNWLFGETLSDNKGFYERDIANRNIRLDLVPAYKKSIYYVSHTAYLMHVSNDVNGLTWDELGQVWYRSMRKGISATSDFMNVRRCVVLAAQEMNFSQKKLETIKRAFEKVGLGAGAVLSGIVTYYNTDQAASGATVSISDTSLLDTVKVYDETIAYTRSNGNFLFRLRPSVYEVNVGISDYVPFTANKVVIESGKNIEINIQLVKVGAGSVSGTIITNKESATPIEGVTLKIRSGWNNQSYDPISTTTTDANGQYSFDLGNDGAGYYTIEMIKDGYTTSTFNVTVSGETKWKNEYLDGNGATNPDNEEPDNPVDPEDPDTPTPTPITGDIPIDEAHFPDIVFRSYVQSNFDTDNNNILSATEVAKVKEIDVDEKEISSLSGIEYFTALTHLSCANNQLTTLDVNKNIALTYLYCVENQLTTLNVSKNIVLKSLYCSINQLTALDVSKNTALTSLNCSNNPLTTLDISKNTALTYLYCAKNQLTALDVSKNVALSFLGCADNRLTTLDVSKNTVLTSLYCNHNQLTTLDISACVALNRLDCYNNKITTLNLEYNAALYSLYCQNNQLTSLNITGCTNLHYLDCSGNKLTKLDLSHCPYLNSSNTKYDSYLNLSSNTAQTATVKTNNASIIIAMLPTFQATHTGEYVFNVSIDKEIPEDSRLILLNESEDLNGVFISGDKNLKVSADFEKGRTYSPVIVAKSESESESSGSGSK